MDIKEIAKRIRKTKNIYMLSMSPDIAAKFAEALIESYKAELLKKVQGGQPDLGEPVAIAITKSEYGVLSAKLSGPYKYIAPYTELFTSDQVAAAIANATKPLEERIQRRMDDIRLQAERQVALEEKCREVSTQLATAQELLAVRTQEFDAAWDQLAKAEQRVAEYNELIYAVQTKNPDETRHQTALRYIRNAENRPSNTAANGASS